MKILLIEDSIQLSANIVRYLSLKNIPCESALDWENWLNKAINNYYDVIILDVNLPNLGWLDVLKILREKQKEIPIIILTSNSSKQDIVDWLNLWADDYMTKPFDFEELLARLNTLNRRNLKNKSNTINFWDNYFMDFEKIELKKWDEIINLSNLEFNLLKYLVQNINKTISRKELFEKVWWEFDWDIMFSKTLDVYIGYLRKKLDSDVIKTVKWIWYKITNAKDD